jgi:hypothetical protein
MRAAASVRAPGATRDLGSIDVIKTKFSSAQSRLLGITQLCSVLSQGKKTDAPVLADLADPTPGPIDGHPGDGRRAGVLTAANRAGDSQEFDPRGVGRPYQPPGQ